MRLGFRVTLLFGCVAWLTIACGNALGQEGADRPNGAEPFRTWADSTGKFSTSAVLTKYADGKVHLRKRDGSEITVPMRRLSANDQRYVRQYLAVRRAKLTRPSPRKSPSHSVSDDNSAPTWPQWLGPERNGKSPDTGLLKRWPEGGPPLVWKTSRVGKGYSSVAVAGGTIYTMGEVGAQLMIIALDMNGKIKWSVPHDAGFTKSYPGSRATPTLDEGKLYVTSGNGRIGCYDARTGKNTWIHHMKEFGGETPGWGFAESVLIHENLAIVTPGGARCIVALDKRTGRPVWTTQGYTAGAQYGSCYPFTYESVSLIATGTKKGLVCVAADSGRVLWTNPFSANNTANCPTPVFSDGYLFWANGYGKGGICLKLNGQGRNITAEQAWTTRNMVCHHGGYIIHEGHIYGNHNAGWSCLDVKTGDLKWRERGVGKGSLCFADGMLYLFSEKSGKAALATCSPDGLEIRGTVDVKGDGPSWAHPVVIGGRLYLRYDTNLYCFNVKAN